MNSRIATSTPKQADSQAPKTVFLAATIVIFFSALSAADSIGFVPYYIDGSTPLTTSGMANTDTLALSDLPELGEPVTPAPADTLPARIVIDAINLDLPVQNPETRDIAALDEILRSGPARYVDSAKLGEEGNVLIFAHSSHLPVVHNKMFKAFNQVPDLSAGDTITLTGEDGTSYLYSVISIEKADASDAIIDLSPTSGRKLTLVTCNTLSAKSARFVLTAEYVGTI